MMEILQRHVDVVVVSNAISIDHYILTLDTVGTLLACDPFIFNVFIIEQTKTNYDGMFAHLNGNVKTVHYDFKFNYNKCLNLGASLGKSPHILFCNNDLIFHRFAISRLFNGWDRYPSVSPYCRLSHNSADYGYVKAGNFLKEGYRIGGRVAGWCIGTERNTWENIGGFDEGVDFWYSDNIYADQIKHKGVKHAIVCNSFVDHLGSKTLNDIKKQADFTVKQKKKYDKVKEKYA